MRLHRRISNPVIALVAVQLIWVVMVLYWVNWFMGRNRLWEELAARYSPELLTRVEGWSTLVQGLLLFALILVGVYTLFIFWRRQLRLYQQQREFITQVTHELKSPLASIQLHLETIRLRRLEPERLENFVDTMLDDTRRLHSQIDNLLLAARLEQIRRNTEPRQLDLTTFIQRYIDENLVRLPPGTRIEQHLQPGLHTVAEAEELGTVLRNLLENAVLYSNGVPELELTLARKGRFAEIRVKDNGRGLEKEELPRIFRRFYRVEQPDERIRGTGLGLYIVQSVIEGGGGKVWVESDGPGCGCTFVLQLPLQERR